MKTAAPDHKIYQTTEAILPLVNRWKDSGLEVVFTNGCFDLVHAGHIDYLWRASTLGDRLVIGLNDDASVTRLKGKNRPVNDLRTRSQVLAALSFVDLVVIFAENTPYELIKAINPDILVKGSDYQKKDIVGYDVLIQSGGKVETIPFLEGYSSSSIIKKIRQ